MDPAIYTQLGFLVLVAVFLITVLIFGYWVISKIDKNHWELYRLVKRVRFTAQDQRRLIYADGGFEDIVEV